MRLNENIKNLPESTLSVKRQVTEFSEKNPSVTLIRLDQDLMNMALPSFVTQGMLQAVEDVSVPYGARLSSPWSGYRSLKSALTAQYRAMGVDMMESEIFITSGLESANACFSALFAPENTVLLTDPCEISLPQLHRCSGRNVSFLRATPENNFRPLPDGQAADLIYLASPSPITGAVLRREEMQAWVDYANEIGAILVFDSSLAEYLLPDSGYPRSIFEIEGAKHCAVELFSFEKGFGVRELKIAQITIPHTLVRGGEHINRLFSMRQPVTATPPSFVMQRAAELLLSQEAREDTERILYRIKKVSRLLSEGLTAAGIPHVGGGIGPYLWAQCPNGMSAWQCFDLLMGKAHLVVTPGSIFGYGGERFFRLTSFGMPEEAMVAVERLQLLFAKKSPQPDPTKQAIENLFQDSPLA